HNPGREALITKTTAENRLPTSGWMSGDAVVATGYGTRKIFALLASNSRIAPVGTYVISMIYLEPWQVWSAFGDKRSKTGSKNYLVQSMVPRWSRRTVSPESRASAFTGHFRGGFLDAHKNWTRHKL